MGTVLGAGRWRMNGEAECPADLEMTAPKNQGEPPRLHWGSYGNTAATFGKNPNKPTAKNQPKNLRAALLSEGWRSHDPDCAGEVGGSGFASPDPGSATGDHAHVCEHADACAGVPAAPPAPAKGGRWLAESGMLFLGGWCFGWGQGVGGSWHKEVLPLPFTSGLH